jgi:ABC-type uncharacterized transport system auxiliary subunit
MYSLARIFALMTILVLVLSGCQSHQAKIDALQKEYDEAETQFRKDCNEEYLKVPPTLSPKCVDEDKKTKDAWSRLQAERAKK